MYLLKDLPVIWDFYVEICPWNSIRSSRRFWSFLAGWLKECLVAFRFNIPTRETRFCLTSCSLSQVTLIKNQITEDWWWGSEKRRKPGRRTITTCRDEQHVHVTRQTEEECTLWYLLMRIAAALRHDLIYSGQDQCIYSVCLFIAPVDHGSRRT